MVFLDPQVQTGASSSYSSSIMTSDAKAKVEESSPLILSEARQRELKSFSTHPGYEFGGPWGVSAAMIGFPLLMYYFWICLEFHEGQLVHPDSFSDILPFIHKLWVFAKEAAFPTMYATRTYLGLMAFQLAIAFIMPGHSQEGLAVPSLGFKKLKYNCNALYCGYLTYIVAFSANYFGIFRLSGLIDHYAEIMTVAIITGFAVSIIVYVATVWTENEIRMSGNLAYDFWMGAALNPRLGSVDLKMWAEVRIPWVLLFLLSCSGACKQYEDLGYVTANMWVMVLATFLYLNACCKGEECIPHTWDMSYEKWGFMIIFWNFAGVPFSYIYPVLYMAKNDPKLYAFPTYAYVALFATLLTAYYFFDTANSQKSRFKMQMDGTYKPRHALPQLPLGTVENPTYIQTAQGNKLLTGGWWGVVRKPSYTADLVQAMCWSLSAGFHCAVPYFYPVFFFVVLVHRTGRDMERCAHKYGKDWDEYCRQVPYKFIPYVY